MGYNSLGGGSFKASVQSAFQSAFETRQRTDGLVQVVGTFDDFSPESRYYDSDSDSGSDSDSDSDNFQDEFISMERMRRLHILRACDNDEYDDFGF